MAKKPARVYSDDSSEDRQGITQETRKHSETHLTRTTGILLSKYDELLHSIYDAVMLTDLDGNIFEVNTRAEDKFGWDKKELCMMNIIDLISRADERLMRIICRNVSDKKYTVLEAICVRSDRSEFNAEIVVNKLRGQEERALCFFIRDITLRKQAEEELRQANEKLVEAEKVQATINARSALYHEINNPLQVLVAMAESDSNKEYSRQLDRILLVLDQLRAKESLGTIADEEARTRYDRSMEKELVDCDSRRLLVVDDEGMLRQMFVSALSLAFRNVKIDSAGDGKHAVDLFNMMHHGVIIMDVSMPVMNGEKAFEEFKAICGRKGWKLPSVIFCTGFVVGESLQKIIGDGSFHSCLKKPLTINDLIKAVQEHLARSAQSESLL